MKSIKTFFRIFISVCLICNNKIAFGQGQITSYDTTSLKKFKWIKLNNYVSYHIINPGKLVIGHRKISYNFKAIASYQYYKKGYLSEKIDTTFKGVSEDMTQFVLSKKFSNVIDFDGLFKINSKAVFVQQPEKVFWRIGVMLKTDDKRVLNKVMNELKKENFVNNVSLDTVGPFGKLKLRHTKVTPVINVKMNKKFENVRAVTLIRKQLSKWPNVDEVTSAMDLFQGDGEQDVVYRITSL